MKSPRSALILAGCALLGLWIYKLLPVLGCLDGCFVDLEPVHGAVLQSFELPDIRLNSWILAWVQRSLVSNPLELFHGNVLYPAPHALTGSEHMLGLAVLTLPARLFTSNAVLLYQLTFVLSEALLVVSTFALVRWLTGSTWASAAAGAMALFMPWRSMELAHLQLLGAHWFPLIWLLVMRILAGEGGRRDGLALSLVLSLQLLSSYYVAYTLTFNLALFVLLVGLQVGLRRGPLLRLSLAFVVPYALLVLTSLPYLARQSRGELVADSAVGAAPGIEVVGRVWSFLAPSFESAWSPASSAGHRYAVPIAVGLLAIATLAFMLAPRGPQSGGRRWQPVATLALWGCVLLSFVMMLGPRIEIGGFAIELPGSWASQLVPGFASLRAPHRFGIAIGIALPVLAGLGIADLDRWIGERSAARTGVSLRQLGRALVGIALVVNLPWRQLPAESAWRAPERVATTYRALGDLPAGPAVEIPWRVDPLTYIGLDTRYMLASTLHWRPILNGFTAHLPPSFKLLRRAAQPLPETDALEIFGRLTDLRWIVVHLDLLGESERVRWRAAPELADLRLAYADAHTLIFELPTAEDRGVWMAALASTKPRATTLSGLARTPLDLPCMISAGPGADAPATRSGAPCRATAEVGRIEAVVEGRFAFRGVTAIPHAVELTVENSSDVPWPGLDYQPEGLVQLRYLFLDGDGRVLHSGTAPLDADFPAREVTRAHPLVEAPARRGHYRLCLELVQRLGPELLPLPVRPLAVAVEVVGTDPIWKRPAERLSSGVAELPPEAHPSVPPECREP